MMTIYVKRLPIRTHVITEVDDMLSVVDRYTKSVRRKDDVVVVSESVLAITQGRAIPLDEIHPGLMANFLVKFVFKTKHGIGIGSPKSMQACIDEVGRFRILLGAAASAVGKLIGIRGWFYRVAGMQSALVDARDGTMPPYHEHVVLGPKDPEGFAAEAARMIGCGVAVVDVNDLKSAWVIGASYGVDRKEVESYLLDNPLGQRNEQTPIGIIRKYVDEDDGVSREISGNGRAASEEESPKVILTVETIQRKVKSK